jgi:hypothetical protein
MRRPKITLRQFKSKLVPASFKCKTRLVHYFAFEQEEAPPIRLFNITYNAHNIYFNNTLRDYLLYSIGIAAYRTVLKTILLSLAISHIPLPSHRYTSTLCALPVGTRSENVRQQLEFKRAGSGDQPIWQPGTEYPEPTAATTTNSGTVRTKHSAASTTGWRPLWKYRSEFAAKSATEWWIIWRPRPEQPAKPAATDWWTLWSDYATKSAARWTFWSEHTTKSAAGWSFRAERAAAGWRPVWKYEPECDTTATARRHVWIVWTVNSAKPTIARRNPFELNNVYARATS